jgi:hypothetical protein
MPDETNPDLLIALADALSTAIVAQFPSFAFAGNTLPVAAEWTVDANVDLKDGQITAPLIWVLDGAESAGSENHLPFEEFQLLVIVQMKIPADCDTAAFARAMSALTASIRKWLRNCETALTLAVGDEAFPCLKAIRPVARNHDEWHHNGRFYSEILTHWRRY